MDQPYLPPITEDNLAALGSAAGVMPDVEIKISNKTKNKERTDTGKKPYTTGSQLSANPAAGGGGGEADISAQIMSLLSGAGNTQPMGLSGTEDTIAKLRQFAGSEPDPSAMAPMQNYAEALGNQTVMPDFSPLVGLVDEWTGSNLSKSYTPPDQSQPEDMLKLQMKMQEDKAAQERQKMAALAEASGMEMDMAKLASDQAERQVKLRMALAKSGEKDAGKILPNTAVQSISDGEASLSLLEDLSGAIENSAALVDPIQGLAAMNPYSIEAKQLLSRIKATKQLVGKFLEGGVLRKEDEAKYNDILPKMTDTMPVARQKLVNLKGMISKKLLNAVDNFGRFGYNTSGFSDKVERYTSLYSDADQKTMDEMNTKLFPGMGKRDTKTAQTNGYRKGQIFNTPSGRLRFKGGDFRDKNNYEPVKPPKAKTQTAQR